MQRWLRQNPCSYSDWGRTCQQINNGDNQIIIKGKNHTKLGDMIELLGWAATSPLVKILKEGLAEDGIFELGCK